MLKPVKHLRVVDQIYEQIRDTIFRGQLMPGDRLLSEREMAKTLEVSRPAVREAIQKLIESNLVETRRGAGTFVIGAESRKQLAPLQRMFDGREFTIQEFLEVRMALECNGAALASQRATEEDIELLEGNIENMKAQALQDPKERTLYQDLSFHMNISYATRNMVQIYLMKVFYDFMISGINEIFPKLTTQPGVEQHVLQQHITIVETIKTRNTEGAQEAMRAHIKTLMEIYKQITGQQDQSIQIKSTATRTTRVG